MRIISPSLLSADFTNIHDEIKILENMNVNRIHLDVMDGNFVETITFGPMIIKAIRNITKMHLETHLMIKNPYKSVMQYIEAGSDTLILHIEAMHNPIKALELIRNNNVKAGIAINPNTNEECLIPFLNYIDYILIMSVTPGKGGQNFIQSTIHKMKNIVNFCKNKSITIGVDGGVNLNTISKVYDTGIDISIVGSALFNSNNIHAKYKELLNV